MNIHSIMKLSDFHNDLLTAPLMPKSKYGYLSNAVFCGLETVNLAIWTTDSYSDFSQITDTIGSIKIPKGLRCLFSIEDLHFLSRDNVFLLADCPAFCCSLTWNEDNALGGGAYGTQGLTELGRLALKEMQKSGKYLDTAHLNAKTFFDCLDSFDGRIINTHTGFFGVCEHPRNITDIQIREIISRGGLIGLTLVTDFLTYNNLSTIDDFIRSIDYFVSKFSYRHLAIGTDFYGTKNLPKKLTNYKNMSILVEKLLEIGYNKEVVESIMFQNMNRLLANNA